MPSSRKITAVVIALAVVGTLLVPLDTVVTGKTGTVDQTENVTAVSGEYVELTGYDIEQGSVSATDAQGNTVDSGNYTVRYDTGEIRFNTTGVVSDGEEVEVQYSYQATDSATTTVAGLVPLMAVLFMLVIIADRLTGMM